MRHDTPMQLSVIEEVVVGLAPEAAWQRMSDLGKAHYYVPGVTDTRIDTLATRGLGASRTVFLKGREAMEETVTEWRERSGFLLMLHRGGRAIAPFGRAEFSYSMRPLDSDRTRIRLELRYRLDRWFLRLLDPLVMRPIARRALRRTASNLRRYYETGAPVNPDAAHHGAGL